MAKDSFILYHSFYEHIEDLSDEDIGKLTRAIFLYEKENKEIELSPVLKMAFSFIKKQLDLNKEKYKERCEKNKANGFKGGRPKSEDNPNKPNGFLENRTEPKKADSDSVSDSDNDSESDNENDLLINSNYSEVEEKNNFSCYGEYQNVFLTNSEYKSLETLIMCQSKLNEYIEQLSENIERGKVKDKTHLESLRSAKGHFAEIKAYHRYKLKNPDKKQEIKEQKTGKYAAVKERAKNV